MSRRIQPSSQVLIETRREQEMHICGIKPGKECSRLSDRYPTTKSGLQLAERLACAGDRSYMFGAAAPSDMITVYPTVTNWKPN